MIMQHALPEPPASLAGRDYLRARDLSREELDGLLDLGLALKAAQHGARAAPPLRRAARSA